MGASDYPSERHTVISVLVEVALPQMSVRTLHPFPSTELVSDTKNEAGNDGHVWQAEYQFVSMDHDNLENVRIGIIAAGDVGIQELADCTRKAISGRKTIAD